MRYLFMSKSLTYTQRAQKTLERMGISANIIKAPSSLSTRGCAYSVSVSYGKGIRAAEILRNANLLQGRIYVQDTNGEFKEAQL